MSTFWEIMLRMPGGGRKVVHISAETLEQAEAQALADNPGSLLWAAT